MKRLVTIALALLGMSAVARAQWVQTGGPEGGVVAAITHVDGATIALLRPDAVYRLGANDRWTPIASLEAERFFTIGNTVLTMGARMMRSTDGGASWSAVGPNHPAQIHGVDDGVVYATSEALLRSSDAGATWSTIEGNIRSLVAGEYTPGAIAAHGDTIIVGEDFTRGVLRSTDGGTTWSIATEGLPDSAEAAILAQFDGVFYGLFSDGQMHGRYGIYRSLDGGATWQELNAGYPMAGERFAPAFSFLQEGSSVLVPTVFGTYRLEDTSWVGVSDGIVIDVTTDAQGRLYRATFGGVLRSDDGETWASVDRGLMNQQVASMYSDGTTVIASAGPRTYRSLDRGTSWQTVAHDRLAEIVSDGDVLLGRGGWMADAGIVRSTDGGATWGSGALGIEHDLRTVSTIAAGEGILYAGFNTPVYEATHPLKRRGGLYRSTDGGESWTLSHVGLPRDNDSTLGVLAVAAYGDTALVELFTGLYRSTDGGESWSEAGAGLPDQSIRTLMAHRGAFYITIDNRVYRSTDAGATFSVTGAPGLLPATPQHLFSIGEALVAELPGEGSRLYILANDTWQLFRVLPDGVDASALVMAGGRLYAGTHAHSVWALDLNTAGVDDGAERMGAQWAPHPLRGETASLEVTLERASEVTLELVDATGRRVAAIEPGALGAGRQRLDLPIGTLTPGAYAWRLSAGAQRAGGVVIVTH